MAREPTARSSRSTWSPATTLDRQWTTKSASACPTGPEIKGAGTRTYPVLSSCGANPVAVRWSTTIVAQPAGSSSQGPCPPGTSRSTAEDILAMAGRAWLGFMNGSSVPQQNIVGAVIWCSSPSLMTLSARGWRKPLMACMSDATVQGVSLAPGGEAKHVEQLLGCGRSSNGAEPLAEQPPIHQPGHWVAQDNLAEHRHGHER